MRILKKLKSEVDSSLRLFRMEINDLFKAHRLPRSLFNGINDFLSRDGKRIRPVLFLAAYLGYSKRRSFNYASLLRSSLSLELLHDFMLIHDDVIDQSPLRRGKPTLHKMFNRAFSLSPESRIGESLSIVAGDIIFAFAIEAFMGFNEDSTRKQAALRKLMETTALTGAGEYIDVTSSFLNITGIKESDVMLNYTLKTARYTFECPMVMGAMLAGAKNDETDRISRWGLLIGTAFQIYDDMLDVFADSESTGKKALSDLQESKKTLLAWNAYTNLKGKDKGKFAQILQKQAKGKKEASEFMKLVIRSGAHQYCRDKILKFVNEAELIEEKIKIKEPFKQLLRGLSMDLSAKAGSLIA